MSPGFYLELYSYDDTYNRMYIKGSDGSKCVGTPDWKGTDPSEGAYGVYFTDYQGECLYGDWYGELTYAEDGYTAESMTGPNGYSWYFVDYPSALYSDYEYYYD